MSPGHALLNLFLVCLLFCGLMPLAGGALLYQGFQKYNVPDLPLRRCISFFFAAAGVAYLLMLLVGRFLPEAGNVAGMALAGAVVVAMELALIVVLVRKFTTVAILVEASAVIATNLAGYALSASLLYGA
jgi:hypothetical protein